MFGTFWGVFLLVFIIISKNAIIHYDFRENVIDSRLDIDDKNM